VAANPKGTVTNITYGSNYVARVYTPPGYSRSQAYPYMFLMHGLGGSEASWHDNDLYAHIQLDNLIAQGAVDPFIIVFTRNDYANWSGFGSILINTLIPYMEQNFCVSTNPANRALGGLSMGGMQTINFGFPNADKFHYLMPSSSAPGIQGQSQLFPNGGELARANLKLIFFTCGSGEVGQYGCNNNNMVRGWAQSAGLGSIIEEYIAQGGAHNAATWRPSFWNFAQLAHQAGFTEVGTMRSMGCTGGGTGGTGGTGGSGGVAGAGGRGGTSGLAGRGGTGGSAGGNSGGRGGSGGGGGRGGQGGGPGGAGGTAATGAGGAIAGSGGTSPAGTGGTSATGAGGTTVSGAGGSAVGTGGAGATGAGGAPAGAGGITATGSAGTGGDGTPTGTGGGGASPGEADSTAGCACAFAPAGARAAPETASGFLAGAMIIAAAMRRRARAGRRLPR
jgi:enterochelin esterase-like enzyme